MWSHQPQRKKTQSWHEWCGLKCSSVLQPSKSKSNIITETVKVCRCCGWVVCRVDSSRRVCCAPKPLTAGGCSALQLRFFHGQRLYVWRGNEIVGSKPLSLLHRPKFSSLFFLPLPNSTSAALLLPTNPPLFYFRSIHPPLLRDNIPFNFVSIFLANRLAD
ncbi:hypothetical protein K440DRAFT_58322 [Wilcoxina mikolae CBS 423.85]|nr:hypothetical protein K440DRAFT_58322 [Wilcoxina mikolae CBS 423.85]